MRHSFSGIVIPNWDILISQGFVRFSEMLTKSNGERNGFQKPRFYSPKFAYSVD